MNAVYLDSNVFIAACIERPTSKSARELLKSIRTGKHPKAKTSSLTIDEVFWIIKKNKGESSAITAAEAILTTPHLDIVPVTRQTLWGAIKIIKSFHLNPRDALHASCAIEHGIQIIISEDSDFEKIPMLKRKPLDASHRPNKIV